MLRSHHGVFPFCLALCVFFTAACQSDLPTHLNSEKSLPPSREQQSSAIHPHPTGGFAMPTFSSPSSSPSKAPTSPAAPSATPSPVKPPESPLKTAFQATTDSTLQSPLPLSALTPQQALELTRKQTVILHGQYLGSGQFLTLKVKHLPPSQPFPEQWHFDLTNEEIQTLKPGQDYLLILHPQDEGWALSKTGLRILIPESELKPFPPEFTLPRPPDQKPAGASPDPASDRTTR